MKLIVGLGNPGDKYQNTRHNIGFILLDKIIKDTSLFMDNNKFNGLIANIDIDGKKVICLKPMTYMNLSGDSVSKVLNFYKIPLSDMLVIYDDIDLQPGTLRFREEGSSGGHNGITDIIKKTGSNKFDRIKIGIGRPENKSQVSDYVLGNFKDNELDLIFGKYQEINNYINKFLNK